jgi:hypothetical protein
MEYYLPIKRNEVLIHPATQVTMRNVMLSEEASCKRPNMYNSIGDQADLDWDPPIHASQVAGITGMNHHASLFVDTGVLLLFYLGWL